MRRVSHRTAAAGEITKIPARFYPDGDFLCGTTGESTEINDFVCIVAEMVL